MPEKPKNGQRPQTLDHLRKKKPLERTVAIVLDDAPLEQVTAAEAEVRRLQADYDSWFRDAREAQVTVLRGMPTEAQKGFLETLPDPPGAESRRIAIESAKDALEAARGAVRDATVYITVRAMGRKRYEALVDAHPPTEEQNAEHMAAHNVPAPYNAETFAAALISESAVDPEMPLEYVQEIWDDWNSAELTELFTAALMVNTVRRSAALGNV